MEGAFTASGMKGPVAGLLATLARSAAERMFDSRGEAV